jgi:hypothetical protein
VWGRLSCFTRNLPVWVSQVHILTASKHFSPASELQAIVVSLFVHLKPNNKVISLRSLQIQPSMLICRTELSQDRILREIFAVAMIKKWIYPCNRPWRPIGLWDVEALTFSKKSAHRWRWGCHPYAPAAFYPPGRFLILISVKGRVDPQMTSTGIESAIFQLVS